MIDNYLEAHMGIDCTECALADKHGNVATSAQDSVAVGCTRQKISCRASRTTGILLWSYRTGARRRQHLWINRPGEDEPVDIAPGVETERQLSEISRAELVVHRYCVAVILRRC